jgi:hypothetical protein
MIQLNYLDWNVQNASKKYEVITKHGVPVFVMEPLRGGRLARPNDKLGGIFTSARPNASQASWAFRFLQALPNVSVILSGMSTLEQLKENIALFSAEDAMSDGDMDIIRKATTALADTVPCTACRYCACPHGIDIPMMLAHYNEASYEVSKGIARRVRENPNSPQTCTNCGKCSPLCPQDIDIPDVLRKLDKLVADVQLT